MELDDGQLSALVEHWENVMDDAARDRVDSWVIAGKAIEQLRREGSELNPEDMDLLRSYANGPRIWDATAIVPAVFRLHGQGLIEPAPPAEDGSARSTYCYQLTDAGRQVLGQEDTE
jgi:hypothetical protein